MVVSGTIDDDGGTKAMPAKGLITLKITACICCPRMHYFYTALARITMTFLVYGTGATFAIGNKGENHSPYGNNYIFLFMNFSLNNVSRFRAFLST